MTPADRWGPPEIQDTGLVRQGGGRSSGAHFPAAPPLRAPQPAALGEVGARVQGRGYVSSVFPLPRSGPVSQPCSPSSSVSPFLLVFSPLLSLFLTCLSLPLHLARSLFTSVPPLCPSPLTFPRPCALLASFPCPSTPASAAAFLEPQFPGLGHTTPSPQSSFRASSNCPSQLRGHMVESQAPAFPVPRGQASWSGSALGSRSRREGGSWSPAI